VTTRDVTTKGVATSDGTTSERGNHRIQDLGQLDLAQRSLIAGLTGATLVDLARPMKLGMPQSPNHPEYRLTMPRRHGDAIRGDGGSAANDLLITGTHVGTHIDALGHVSHCGELYGGVVAEEAQRGGSLAQLGVDTIEPIVARGLLLDIPRVRGIDCLAAGDEITPDDLEQACVLAAVVPQPGDVLLIRSGWGKHWEDNARFVGRECGVPGVGEAGARWLASKSPRAVGADTIAFERLAPGAGHALLPAHRVLLVESGIYIIENMALDELGALLPGEFVLIVAPLYLVGATGSPVRPLAMLPKGVAP
jgi:kynurenine formamidase